MQPETVVVRARYHLKCKIVVHTCVRGLKAGSAVRSHTSLNTNGRSLPRSAHLSSPFRITPRFLSSFERPTDFRLFKMQTGSTGGFLIPARPFVSTCFGLVSLFRVPQIIYTITADPSRTLDTLRSLGTFSKMKNVFFFHVCFSAYSSYEHKSSDGYLIYYIHSRRIN